LKASAELWTPDGLFIKCADSRLNPIVLAGSNAPLTVSGATFIDNTVEDCAIGILVQKDGLVSFAVYKGPE